MNDATVNRASTWSDFILRTIRAILKRASDRQHKIRGSLERARRASPRRFVTITLASWKIFRVADKFLTDDRKQEAMLRLRGKPNALIDPRLADLFWVPGV